MERILIVDDERMIQEMLKQMLEMRGYLCQTVSSGEEALEELAQNPYELVLCDMNMRGITGMEVIEHIRQNYPQTASIMVTGTDDPQLAETAIRTGAYGYLVKPFRENVLNINVINSLIRRRLEIESREHRQTLEAEVEDRTRELTEAMEKLKRADVRLRYSHQETINRLLRVAEFRDNETARHVQRMSHYCEFLSTLAGKSREESDLIRIASAMHDIGKLGIPDHILLKPGKLTDEEYSLMKEHAQIGFNILRGSKVPMLETAAMIALTHHEKYDGSGYPKGLKKDHIPLAGRITAICDVFDALTSIRPYKPGFSWYEAINWMRQHSGSHFDPGLLDLFINNMDHVVSIKAKYPDHEA
ncbi:MAG: response regulator [Deltaproteobacteria bacterium]|nr:response regulator [Deltaproteobacteria bacterium]